MTQFRQLEQHHHYLPPPTVKSNHLGFIFREHNAGEAWYQLKQQPEAFRRGVVVVTSNPCPEYALDLLELGICAVLPIGFSEEAIATVLEFAQHGVTYSFPHHFPSCLSKSEREVFRFIVCGMSNYQIARQMRKSMPTVRNKINQMLSILDLQNRTQLAMYYLGHWQFLGRSMSNFMLADSMATRVD
ncbi:MAG: hypothetical protein RLZZ156_909 [Deinococcota bacterium]|jgi:DNA-binding NarL/FixJ family response regulator